MASIAFEHGFLEETLWKLPDNAKLAAGRRDRRILLPGDRVFIPELRLREEACATDKRHQFIRKGLPEMLRIVLRDEDGRARPNLRYTLTIDQKHAGSGSTDGHGILQCPIPPNAREGALAVFTDEGEEHYQLYLGHLDPPSTETGVQARLNNLGYFCGEVDGVAGQLTKAALRRFQEAQNLAVTGELTDETRDAVVKQHGF